MTPPSEDDGSSVAETLRREHSLGDGVRRLTPSSLPVFVVGDAHVVKLFPPEQRGFFETERATLAFLDGRLPIRTPRFIDAGERGEWLYVVMTRVPGGPLAEVWPAADSQDRIRMMREAGAALAALHGTAAEGPPLPAIDWRGFMEGQRASAADRQRAKGLGDPWVDSVGHFLARWTPERDGAPALLHTEIMREHFLADNRDGAWHVSGLIDFEDAMLGAREYDFASAGIFLSCAEPRLLRAFLDGYGKEADDELPFRIMAYALLHKYSNLRWYLERLPFQGKEGDLESLARAWFTP